MHPRSRTVLLGAAAVFVSLALGVLASREPRALPHGVAPAMGAQAASSERPERLSSSEETVDAAAASSAGAQLPPDRRITAESTEPPKESTRKPSVVLRGSVLLVDARGRPVMPWDGVLSFTHHAADADGNWIGLAPRRAIVTNGDWSVELDDAATSRLSGFALVAGDRNAVIDEPVGLVALPPERFLELRAHFPPPASLRVVDAGSGRDLAGVSLATRARNEGSLASHPGVDHGNRVLAFDLQSPIDLDYYLPLRQRTNVNLLHVGAPGYAWSQVAIDFAWGGERLVALARGGDLEVDVRGLATARKCVLRVRSVPGGELLVAQPLPARDALRAVGLPAGMASVAVEVLQSRARELVDTPLASAQVEILAGALTSVVLDVPASAANPQASISGIVLVPSGWDAGIPIVQANPLDAPIDASVRRMAGTSAVESPRAGWSAFEFGLDALPIGRYELRVADPPFTSVIELPHGGVSGLTLEIPPPCELAVRVVDARGGELVRDVAPQWSFPGSAAPAGYASFDSDRGAHVILAPCGPIELSIADDAWQPCQARLDVGPNAVATVEVTRACGFVLLLSDRGIPVSFASSTCGSVVAAEGEPAPVRTSEAGPFVQRYRMEKPGEYVVTPPCVPGYQPPAPVTIVVPADGYVEHVVRLERSRR